MIIVLEGADHTGKSTLAAELVKLGFRYTHFGPPKPGENLFERYTRALDQVKRGEDVVFDRLHLGELVYGPVMRGKSQLTLPQARLINRYLFAKGGVLVMCTAPPAEIIAGWKSRQKDEYVDGQEKIEAVIKGYTHLWLNELGSHACVYRYQLATWRGNAGKFAQCLVELKTWHADLTKRWGATGSPGGKYLVVGERVNAKRDLAFYADNNSSEFLNACLEEAGYKEQHLLFTNALDKHGRKRDFRSLIRPVPERKVIALGRVAQAACRRLGVLCYPAPHPQYVKRFQKGRYHEYVALLKSFRECK